jgi:PAS domain S-box-containing protein
MTSVIILVGYMTGKPLLYGPGQIPVALNTAICFLLLGINITIESTFNTFNHQVEKTSGHNRSIHLYSIGLAVIITGILFFGYLNVQTIFRNLQEEVKNKMLMVVQIKELEILNNLEKGIDSTLIFSSLEWPLDENNKGTIHVFSETSGFPGWKGRDELTEYQDEKGTFFEVCFNRVDNTPWVISCQIQKGVAFKPIIQQFLQVTILIFCLLALTITTLILINRQSRLHFYREQVETVEKLKMAEDQFRNAFEHSSVGKTMIYMDGSFHVNKAFAAMLGYTVEELNRKNWIDITFPDDEEASKKEMNLLIQGTKESTRFEKRYVHKNGDIIWIDLQSYLQRDKEGNPLYFITSASNISEYKELQEQLIRSKEEAERSNKLKDAFIANISHEIRTPLNAILGFTDLMRDELEEKGVYDFDNYFDIIRTSGSRLTRTVDMILNVSRLQVGEFEPQHNPVRIDKLVLDLVSEYKLAAQKKGIGMEFVNSAGTAIIQGDEYCYTHSISNLIDNAVKYTQSGQITLTLYRNELNALCLDVADTGIGISREFIEEIFNPFTQEDTSSTRKFEGIGLGLSIAQRLLALTKASISVRSEKGQGTLFTITF